MKRRILRVTSVGNILEWFDFGLFVHFAPAIGSHFFYTHDTKSATFAAFGVFAVGFICRPLGGILFGHFGDRNGRAKTLRWSILMISLTTLLIGFLPSYHAIGISASILFTLLRLLQGISVGGEYGGVMVYLAESAPDKRRGFFTSFAAIGANLGFLFATLTVICLKAVMPADILEDWGWRIPFISLGVLGFIILYYRLQLSETPAYLSLKASHKVEKQPLLAALRHSPWQLLQIVGLTCMGSTLYFVIFWSMPNYLLHSMKISLDKILGLEAVVLGCMLLLIPLAGLCGDRFGRKKVLLITALSIIILTWPCFYLLKEKTIFFIILGFLIPAIFSSMEQGNTLTTIVENCPLTIRYTGVSFAYNLGNTLFGATTPLIVSILSEQGNYFMPAYYLMGMTFISLLAIMTLNMNHQMKFWRLAALKTEGE